MPDTQPERQNLRQLIRQRRKSLSQAEQINAAWESVVNKEARYRYVIDAATF